MFVLDCSMTMEWAFRDETTPGTMDALELAAGEACVAPVVWPLEVCNAVLTAQRRGRFTSDDVPRFSALVGGLRVSVEEGGLQHTLDDVLPLAMQLALSSSDAAYLERVCARRRRQRRSTPVWPAPGATPHEPMSVRSLAGIVNTAVYKTCRI